MSVILLLTFLFPAVLSLNGQEVPVYSFAQFEQLLQKRNDTTYVLNFWATWCVPCVKELPDFEKAGVHFNNKKFRLVLVSLDFKSQINSSLIPFLKAKKIRSGVILLSEPDPNSWIDKVNRNWTGSIPMTIIYNRDFYFFREGSMSFSELENILTKNIIP